MQQPEYHRVFDAAGVGTSYTLIALGTQSAVDAFKQVRGLPYLLHVLRVSMLIIPPEHCNINWLHDISAHQAKRPDLTAAAAATCIVSTDPAAQKYSDSASWEVM
jgi:hypothetical protein